jgi:response regulator RpfG family c-di-GMP phosphodiesterase
MSTGVSEHNSTVQIERITQHVECIRKDQAEIKEEVRGLRDAVQKMSEAIARLALIEERQAATSQTIERVMSSIEKLDERVRALEVAEPMQAKTTEWVQSAIWAAASAAVMFIASKAGLF